MIRWIAPVACVVVVVCLSPAQDDKSGIVVDKDKKTVTIDAKIAPRLVYKEVYPIEVIASWPHPKGKKAHETIVTIDANPSEVHKALVSLGLKAGAPLIGDQGDKEPQGPDVNLYIEVPTVDGPKRLTMDKVLLDKRTQKPFPKGVKFRFTGSVDVQPDPNNPAKIYGADQSGALAVIFPVLNQTVLQTNLTMKYESAMKLETNTKVLPKEGTKVGLVIEVAK